MCNASLAITGHWLAVGVPGLDISYRAVSKSKSVVGLVVCFGVAFSAATIGSIASIRAAEFYEQLSRPSWAPPGSVFGPVWTFLFCCMALASWLVWREGRTRSFTALAVYVIQLILNALWSWLFFAWRNGRWAFIEVLFLWAAILLTIRSSTP